MTEEEAKYDEFRSGLSFSEAFADIREGGSAMRLPQWSPDVVIQCQHPDGHSKMTHAYLYAHSRYGNVPWKETVVELFSMDWCVVSEVGND